MEHFLRTLFNGKASDATHHEFIKFSRGNYEKKYLINAKKQKNAWNIKTGAEFANYLVRSCLEEIKGTVAVTGVIVSTANLSDSLPFKIERVKQFMGVKQMIVRTTLQSKDVLAAMDANPRAFFALSFSTPDTTLKIKEKAPKSAKPASGGEKEVVADFCSLKTTSKKIVDSLLFDVGDFEELSIQHTLLIESIEIPKGISDPVQIREQSKRKGKIIRIKKIDGVETRSEASFFG